MIDVNKVPVIMDEQARGAKMVLLSELKDIHLSFSGFGVGEGDVISFPTADEVEANPRKYFKVMATYPGSKNKSGFVLVERNGKTDWLNLSVLSRQMYDADGNRQDIDEFRTMMRDRSQFQSDEDRVRYLLGKTIKGTSTISAYAPEFDRTTRQPVPGKWIEAKYVTIDVVSKPASQKKK